MALSNIISAAALALTLASRRESQENQEELESRFPGEDIASAQTETAENTQRSATATQELVEIEGKRGPTPGAVDAYVGQTISLDPGQAAVVEVTAMRGYDLRMEKIEFDRRDDHSYSISVDGEEVSSTHRAIFTSPRRIKFGGKLIATVTNESNDSTTFDLEVEAWAEPV